MNYAEKVSDHHLERFMSEFWGYGVFSAPIWMVGMEEACGERDFVKRISTWQLRGEQPLEDLATYHDDLGYPEHFLPGARLQRTWSKLIRAYLAANGCQTDVDNARQFQISSIGRSDQPAVQTCLIELMPLPSPSTKKWLVKNHTDLGYLQRRKDYFKRVAPRRVERLKELINKHQPKAVVFYGLGYRAQWEQVAGKMSSHPKNPRTLYTRSEGTMFFAMPHPVSHGVTNHSYIKLGDTLRDNICTQAKSR
ncbi:uracil-DNA glycosylase family protein [Sulfitobacter indolifex]|uniref:hypothetical protein n=1 Tax=Sulfitobacter indolifex TaxID=225422 RepID=UPI001FAC4253|nr:hypothetical protein [Sulfitobacter indolifex]